ncbi:MAG: Crp/Fnr family transcriptional regulator [Acetanaerobacterium sp.]
MALTAIGLAFLRDVLPFWGSLSDEQRHEIELTTTGRSYRMGESLHNGAVDCSGMLIIRSGQVRAYMLSPQGKEITLYRLLERDTCLLTASCMLKNISFEINIEAEHDTEAMFIPTLVYDKLTHSSIAVSDYTGQMMSSRLSDVMWVMEQVMFSSFDKRLANFLLEQSAMDASDTLHITHEIIAKHLGSAREVVTRMLKYFQDEGMVTLSRGGIVLADRAHLERLTDE